jgi:hypothetical protein
MNGSRLVIWWDRFWGAVWLFGSIWVAYLTARWFAEHATPSDLGALRWGLIAFAAIFGLLIGMFGLSLAVIGITSGLEKLLARLGWPLPRPPAPAPQPNPRSPRGPATVTEVEGPPPTTLPAHD